MLFPQTQELRDTPVPGPAWNDDVTPSMSLYRWWWTRPYAGGAVLVVEDRKLVGIFTERDAVIRVIAQGRDVRTTKLGEVMTASPITIDPDKSFGYALLLMHEKGFRHMPVLDSGDLVGIVSARNALDPDLEEFIHEANRRKQFLRERM